MFNVFCSHLKSQFTKRNTIIGIAGAMLLLLPLHRTILDFKSHQKELLTFDSIENLKPKIFPLYGIYGTYGITIISSPNDVAVFFSINVLFSYIDTGIGLKIIKDLKREGSTSIEANGFGLFLTLYILALSLFIGTMTFCNREVLKSLKSIFGKLVVIPIALSKYIFLSLYLLLIFSLSYLYCRVMGVHPKITPLIHYFFNVELLILFFLSTGIFFDMYLPKLKTISAILFFAFSMLFFPKILSDFMKTTIDTLEMEYENLEQLMKFEDRFFEKIGRWDSSKPAPKSVMDILDDGQKNEYKTMRRNEEKTFNKLKTDIKRRHLIYAIFPPTYIISFHRELNGGDRYFIEFFGFSKSAREDFIKFYIQKKFREGDKRGCVIRFNGEQIFNYNVKFPYSHQIGELMAFLWSIFLLIMSWLKFLKLYKVDKKLKDFNIEVKPRLNYFYTKSDEIKHYIYCSFTKKGGEIYTDFGSDEFIYLPPLNNIQRHIEKLISHSLNCNLPVWERILIEAVNSGKIVVTSWKLDDFDKEEILKFYSIINNGYFLNIGDDLITYWFADNQITYEGDTTTDCQNLYALAKRLGNARN